VKASTTTTPKPAALAAPAKAVSAAPTMPAKPVSVSPVSRPGAPAAPLANPAVQVKPVSTNPAIPLAPLAASPAKPASPVPAMPAPANEMKPVSRATKGIKLQLVNPSAKSVAVAGSFNEWNPARTPLKPAGEGKWVGELNGITGRHEYLFVVDGQWLPDPNAKESVQNPYGGRNSVLVVPSN